MLRSMVWPPVPIHSPKFRLPMHRSSPCPAPSPASADGQGETSALQKVRPSAMA